VRRDEVPVHLRDGGDDDVPVEALYGVIPRGSLGIPLGSGHPSKQTGVHLDRTSVRTDASKTTMAKSNAATVIDLEEFRQKKMRQEERASETTSTAMRDAAMLVPVWFCWVPVWAPMS
jgi:hypothetical protein